MSALIWWIWSELIKLFILHHFLHKSFFLLFFILKSLFCWHAFSSTHWIVFHMLFYIIFLIQILYLLFKSLLNVIIFINLFSKETSLSIACLWGWHNLIFVIRACQKVVFGPRLSKFIFFLRAFIYLNVYIIVY